MYKSSRSILFLVLISFSFVFTESCMDRFCSDLDHFMESFDDFSNDIKEHYESFEIADWKKLDKEYKEYVDKCYPQFKSEMSLEEKVSFLKNAFLYDVYREESGSAPDIESLHTVDLGREVQELGSEAQEELEKFLKDNLGNELEKAVDDILDGLNQIGNEIKDWLKTGEKK